MVVAVMKIGKMGMVVLNGWEGMEVGVVVYHFWSLMMVMVQIVVRMGVDMLHGFMAVEMGVSGLDQ